MSGGWQDGAGDGSPGVAMETIGETAELTAEARDQLLYDAVLDFRAGRYEESEAKSRRLLAAIPHFFPALLLLGMTVAKTGAAAEAIESLRQAIALDRRSIDARNELASLLRSEGRTEDAVIEARHAVRLNPDEPGSHNNLALCYLVSGRVPPAIVHFKKAIGLQPDNAMFQHNLGLALQMQSRDVEAMAAFRHALDLDPTHPEALAHLGRLLVIHGQPDEAARCYERAAAAQPDATLGALHQAEALMQQGRAAEAENCLRQAIAARPDSDLAYQVLGVLQQRLGRFADANASFERAIDLQPKRVSAYLSLIQGKKINTADQPLVQRMLAMVGDGRLTQVERSRLHYALGKAYDDLADYETANRHFDRANKIEADQMRQAGRSFDRRRHKAVIDQAIEGFTAEFFSRHATDRSDSDLPVFIVGMPRSGTTLVEQILSSHREIGAAGELSYWTDRLALAGSALSGGIGEAGLRRLADDYLALLRSAAPLERRVTDKMPANFLVLGLIHLVLPRARIIHCRRDPVDTCLSIYATPFSNPLDFAHDRADLVFFYQQYARLMTHWRSVIPRSRMLEIDYETLVAEPERATREMIDFCQLGWDEACLRHQDNQHLIMTPSLWQARQPVYRDAVERWRRYEGWLGAFRDLLNDR